MTNSPKQFRKIISVLFLINLIWLNGCSLTVNSNSSNSNSPNLTTKKTPPSDNLSELLNVIKIPVVPDDVVWSEVEQPNQKKITAVLQYEPKSSPEEEDRLLQIVTLLDKYKQAEPAEVGIEDWFPEQLKAKAQLSGVEAINGTSYGANEFFNIPYGSGKITRIEGTNYFVLELIAN